MTTSIASLGTPGAVTVDPVVIEVPIEPGVVLRGHLRIAGRHGALVVHDTGEDLDGVEPVALDLARAGLTTISFDLRGHGASDGAPDRSASATDVERMVHELQRHAPGLRFLVAVGASAAAILALQDTPGVAAIVLMSPTLDVPHGVTLPRSEVPVAIVVGGHAPAAVRAAELVRDHVPGYCTVIRLPTADQGTAILRGDLRLQAIEQVRLFLVRHRRTHGGSDATDR